MDDAVDGTVGVCCADKDSMINWESIIPPNAYQPYVMRTAPRPAP
jgi:hypothetical protein